MASTMRASRDAEGRLQQSSGTGPRGRIDVTSDGFKVIRLFVGFSARPHPAVAGR